jgi:uncharacterized protein with NRDE domain
MCLLIVIIAADPDYPILVASNRDEERARLASPPGLFVGARRRMLSPRDRRAGGTWLAVGEQGLLAGLTNAAGAPAPAGARTRGRLPHLALDEDDLDAAAAAVVHEVESAPYAGFQLVLADGAAIAVVQHAGGATNVTRVAGNVAVVTNEHRLGELALPELAPALAPGLAVRARLALLAEILRDEGGPDRHRILKKGGAYGTVSSALIAVPRGDPRRLIWRYAPGPPDEVAYREYGNLGRRLAE